MGDFAGAMTGSGRGRGRGLGELVLDGGGWMRVKWGYE